MTQRNSAILAAIASIAFLADLSSQAFAKPNFSGDWKMDPAKSNYGRMPAPESLERKITHNDPELKIVSTQSGPRGSFTTDLNFTTDGKECVNKIRNIDVKSTAHWNGDALLINSTENYNGAEVRQDEKWTLSADGKTLTIGTQVSTPRGQYEVITVFDKQ